MKYVQKNQNHRALCYYAMDNHMYLVKDKDLVKSMVEKAKAPEHKIKTSILEFDELEHPSSLMVITYYSMVTFLLGQLHLYCRPIFKVPSCGT
jgi:hypothetical protein